MRRGFSLVELSIVLVILGLLTGGILAGQSLIRAAELRSVSTQLAQFNTALNTFRDKYFALPGDMPDATRFWPATVNGNGDGFLPSCMPGPNVMSDSFHAWEQLALAGLIEGSYTGTAVTSPNPCNGISIPGSNVPAGKLGISGWTIIALNQRTNSETGYNDLQSTIYNWLIFGAPVAVNGMTNGGIMKPEELWNLDTKLDDGKPGTGTVRGGNGLGGSATACMSSASSTSTYNLNLTTVNCNPVFPLN